MKIIPPENEAVRKVMRKELVLYGMLNGTFAVAFSFSLLHLLSFAGDDSLNLLPFAASIPWCFAFMLLPLLFIYPLVKWGLKETARFREVFLFGIPLLNLYALTRWFRPLPGVEKKPFYVFVALFAYFQLSALSSFYFADRWIAVLNLILFLAAFCCEYLICRGPFRKTREFVRSAYPDDF